jgi:hypothetical protein
MNFEVEYLNMDKTKLDKPKSNFWRNIVLSFYALVIILIGIFVYCFIQNMKANDLVNSLTEDINIYCQIPIEERYDEKGRHPLPCCAGETAIISISFDDQPDSSYCSAITEEQREQKLKDGWTETGKEGVFLKK